VGPITQRKPRRTPRTTITILPDGDDRKKFPSGFSSCILSIQNYWHSLISPGGKEHLTPPEFCGDVGHFGDTYKIVIERYRAIKKKPGKSLAKTIFHLTKGDQAIELIHILAFAEYVRLPAGLFVLFAELVDAELKSLDDIATARENSLAILRRARRAIEALETYADQSWQSAPPFTHIYDETPDRNHLAKALALKTLADAYNSDKKSASRSKSAAQKH
jgi:hypothetical protein